MPVADAQKKGISTVYQEINLCPNLSVAENLFIGREPLTKFGTIKRKAMIAKAAQLMKDMELDIDVTRNLEEYSLAMQQMIAIARAVDMECKVLILDEPTSSLDDNEVEKLFGMMRRLRNQGVGIIFVTHFLEQVYAVCDGITVLRNGQLVGEYSIEELPRVKLVAAMMGKDFDDLAAIRKGENKDFSKEPLEIDAKGLSHAGKIKPYDLEIHKGEVVGLTGLLGSGRSELARTIYGADRSQSGTLKVDGKERKMQKDDISGTESMEDVVSALEQDIERMTDRVYLYQLGRVLTVSDGICWMDGRRASYRGRIALDRYALGYARNRRRDEGLGDKRRASTGVLRRPSGLE